MHNLQYLLGERSKIPDHNFLRFNFKYISLSEDTDAQRESNFSQIIFNTKVFKLKRIPANFLSPEGAQWLSGRVLDSRSKGRGFEPHRRHCVVVLEQDTFILA